MLVEGAQWRNGEPLGQILHTVILRYECANVKIK